ncbi:MAG: SMC-Scp complex subunit ScpB [Gemmataceae bacterium]
MSEPQDDNATASGFVEALESVGETEGTGFFAKPDDDTPPPPPIRILEALLFVGSSPLSYERARHIIRGLAKEQFQQSLDELNATYRRQARPYGLAHCPDGWSLTLRPQFHSLREKVFGGVKEARLSTAAVDVLALVAYRQPCTKADVDTWRGADSGALLKQLVRRGLLHVVYRAEAEKREVSYGTTARFLEVFGLTSLDDLPKTQDLQQI